MQCFLRIVKLLPASIDTAGYKSANVMADVCKSFLVMEFVSSVFQILRKAWKDPNMMLVPPYFLLTPCNPQYACLVLESYKSCNDVSRWAALLPVWAASMSSLEGEAIGMVHLQYARDCLSQKNQGICTFVHLRKASESQLTSCLLVLNVI